jgi:hypothetical protein
MKIQNKYVFRKIISEFLYIFFKKRLSLAWLPSSGAWVTPDPSAWVWYNSHTQGTSRPQVS